MTNQARYSGRWCPHCQRYVSSVHDRHVTDGWYAQ